MNREKFKTIFTWAAVLGAAVLFAVSLKLPLWHLKMEAPQYQDEEALRVQVYPAALRGDLQEIQLLNQYIGVRVPERLPQLRWLPLALLAAAVAGPLALRLGRRGRSRVLFASAAILALVLAASAAQAQWQMYQLGHQRDPHAVLKGVGDFTPPILGRVKVANFEITSGLGVGALLIAAGLLLQAGAGLANRRKRSGCPQAVLASASMVGSSEAAA